MLQSLNLGRVRIDTSRVLPPVLLPLVQAAESGLDLVPEIESITRHFGFNSFKYVMTRCSHPHRDGRVYVFTTHAAEWVKRYDQLAYVEVDPRIADCWDRAVPLIWDQTIMRRRGAKTDAFLDDAIKHGVASGVCLPMRDSFEARAMVGFNSTTPVLNRVRQREIADYLGDMLVFANYFHDLFMKSIVAKIAPPITAGLPLSPRERECLSLAAHGFTSDVIATKLGIAPRTVRFHFYSIRSKLGAATREESVARAIKDGQITV